MTTFGDSVKVGGDNSKSVSANNYRPSESSALHALWFTTSGSSGFDPTSSTQILIGVLPANAVAVNVRTLGGATGGTSPTVNIGTSGSATAFANGIRADTGASALSAGVLGASIGTVLTAPTEVYGKVGSSAATGGTVTGYVEFIIVDNLAWSGTGSAP